MSLRRSTLFALLLTAALIAGCHRVDLSTPKSAAKSFFSALDKGDAIAAAKASTGDENLVTSMANAYTSMKKFHSAIKDKFGDKAVNDNNDKLPDWTDRVDQANEKINGDSATLTSKDGDTLDLKKVGGDWKVDINSMMGPMANANTFDNVAKAANNVADQVNSGKIKSVQEAQTEFGKEAFSGMLGGH